MVLVLSWMSPPLISNFPTNLSTSCCKIEELKKKVRRKLMGTTDEWECMRTIDSLHRLDIARHFDHEIETRLSSTYHKLCGRKTHHDHDLNAAALRFRLLRQRRFSISPGKSQPLGPCLVGRKRLGGDGKAAAAIFRWCNTIAQLKSPKVEIIGGLSGSVRHAVL